MIAPQLKELSWTGGHVESQIDHIVTVINAMTEVDADVVPIGKRVHVYNVSGFSRRDFRKFLQKDTMTLGIGSERRISI